MVIAKMWRRTALMKRREQVATQLQAWGTAGRGRLVAGGVKMLLGHQSLDSIIDCLVVVHELIRHEVSRGHKIDVPVRFVYCYRTRLGLCIGIGSIDVSCRTDALETISPFCRYRFSMDVDPSTIELAPLPGAQGHKGLHFRNVSAAPICRDTRCYR